MPSSSKVISVGIKGDRGKISSTAVSTTSLTAEQKADLADINYGVFIIGVKDCTDSCASSATATGAEVTTTGCLSTLTVIKVSENEKYAALITYNYGKTVRLDAIGYLSGSMTGFAQTQDVFVSADGVTWAKVESGCYDAVALGQNGGELINLGKFAADSTGNTSAAFTLFDLGGVTAKYVRVGIVTGVLANSWDMNTYELIVYRE